MPILPVISGSNSIFAATGTPLTLTASDTLRVDYGAYLIAGVNGNEAVRLLGSGQSYDVTNDGTIASYSLQSGAVLVDSGNYALILNSGVILGTTAGIVSFGDTDIVNIGTIRSDRGTAVQMQGPGNFDQLINNTDLGSIMSPFGDAIQYTIGGTHSITNTGIILAGSGHYALVSLGAGVELVTNAGTILGMISLGDGNDRIDTRLGWAANAVDMGAGQDNYVGGGRKDTVDGGAGADHITGAGARDVLTGGSQADRFIYENLSDTGTTSSTRDRITDFTHLADDIDLKLIDANALASGDQAFRFVGAAAFSKVAGELHFLQHDRDGTANDKTIVGGDVDGDGKADFQIELTGLVGLTKADFLL